MRPVLAGVAAAAAGIALGPIGPAAAESVTVADPTADVWHQVLDDEGLPDGWERDRARTLEDATSVRYRHTDDSLYVVISFRDIRYEAWLLSTRTTLRMPGGRTATLSVDTQYDPSTDSGGDGEPDGGGAARLTLDDGAEPCGYVPATVDAEVQETVAVRVYRSCLDNPRWVRASTVVIGADPGRQRYEDVTGTRAHAPTPMTARLRPGSPRG